MNTDTPSQASWKASMRAIAGTGPITTTLSNGATVLAKRYTGAPVAKTYANLTQARAAQVKLGDGWGVFCWGRPFYVARIDAEGRPV